MKHRIISDTGLGSNVPPLLPNNIELKNKTFWDKFYDSAAKAFKLIDDYGGFDYRLSDVGFDFGIEPTYQFDELLIIHFDFIKKEGSYIERGKAFAAYGTGIRSTTRRYGGYKRKNSFTTFIDEWYEVIVNELRGTIQ